MNGAEWTALGVAGTLLCAFVAHRVGLIQISLMTKVHELNVKLATPQIGTEIRIEDKAVAGWNYYPSYYLRTTIYNEGDLAALDLNGQWKLTSPTKSVAEVDFPIHRDSLRSEFKLEPVLLSGPNELLGNAMRNICDTGLHFNVDIELSYRGIDVNKAQQYKAHYEFDPKNPRLLKRIY